MSDLTKIAETGTRTVTIVGNVRCVNDGEVYTEGMSATVPLELANEWIRARWATAAAEDDTTT